MIEKMLVSPDDVVNNSTLFDAVKRINELIEASNRQDRAIAAMITKRKTLDGMPMDDKVYWVDLAHEVFRG